jgi:hypothetical protein
VHKDWVRLCLKVNESEKKYNNINDLTIITYSNYNEKTFLELKFEKLGLPILVAKHDGSDWFNYYKIYLLNECLDKIDTKYFLALDADDILLLNEPEYILKKFLNGFECKLLFSGDCLNHPVIPNCFEDKVNSNNLFRYLNSGGIIGEVEYSKVFFKQVESKIDKIIPSDQFYIRQCLEEHYPKIQIDYNCRIFQTLFNSDKYVDYIDKDNVKFLFLKKYTKQRN